MPHTCPTCGGIDACPKCGRSDAWDGTRCNRCRTNSARVAAPAPIIDAKLVDEAPPYAPRPRRAADLPRHSNFGAGAILCGLLGLAFLLGVAGLIVHYVMSADTSVELELTPGARQLGPPLLSYRLVIADQVVATLESGQRQWLGKITRKQRELIYKTDAKGKAAVAVEGLSPDGWIRSGGSYAIDKTSSSTRVVLTLHFHVWFFVHVDNRGQPEGKVSCGQWSSRIPADTFHQTAMAVPNHNSEPLLRNDQLAYDGQEIARVDRTRSGCLIDPTKTRRYNYRAIVYGQMPLFQAPMSNNLERALVHECGPIDVLFAPPPERANVHFVEGMRLLAETTLYQLTELK